MRVLYAVSEIFPYVKTGGLGDVAAALPLTLARQGLDISLFLPGHTPVLDHLTQKKDMHRFRNFFGQDNARLVSGVLDNGMKAYVLQCDGFFDRPGVYVNPEGGDWQDNHLRYAAFCHAAAHLGDYTRSPDIIHGNDWPCGLIPAYVRQRTRAGNKADNKGRPATVMTIHNLAYQGLFDPGCYGDLGLSTAPGHSGLEFYNKLSFMKSGLTHADQLLTVSPTYAREIQTKEFGCGLEDLLMQRAHHIEGILNGMDHSIWDPRHDRHIARTYDSTSLEGKRINKMALLHKLGLIENEGPLFAAVGRLTWQKGFDVLQGSVAQIIRMGGSLVVLGSGEKPIKEAFHALADKYPGRIAMVNYAEEMAHQVFAAADMLVVPSHYEPCGLVQMYAMRYGAVPIVHRTGGLADSVMDVLSHRNASGTGFHYRGNVSPNLDAAIERAVALYRDPELWRNIQQNAMAENFTWDEAAERHEMIYAMLMEDRTRDMPRFTYVPVAVPARVGDEPVKQAS